VQITTKFCGFREIPHCFPLFKGGWGDLEVRCMAGFRVNEVNLSACPYRDNKKR